MGTVLLSGSVAGAAPGIRAGRLFLHVFVLELVKVKHYIRLAAQVPLEPVQCDSNYVSMPYSLAGWNLTYLKPDFMYQTNVIDGQGRRMAPR